MTCALDWRRNEAFADVGRGRRHCRELDLILRSESGLCRSLTDLLLQGRIVSLYARADHVSWFRTGGCTPGFRVDGVIGPQIAPYHTNN